MACRAFSDSGHQVAPMLGLIARRQHFAQRAARASRHAHFIPLGTRDFAAPPFASLQAREATGRAH